MLSISIDVLLNFKMCPYIITFMIQYVGSPYKYCQLDLSSVIFIIHTRFYCILLSAFRSMEKS